MRENLNALNRFWFWFFQRFMSSLMAVFSQTAGSKKGLFSICFE